MGQIVLKLTQSEIMKMKNHYANALKTTPPGAVFAAKTPNSSITAYNSGKVLFQGKAPEIEAKRWGDVKAGSPTQQKKKSAASTHRYAPSPSLFESNHVGSDEAGTGDYFGPITVAAAYVSKDQIPLLKEIGVKDSKNLTDDMIQSIAKQLIQMKLPYSLVILHNEKYNRLQRKGWSQGKMKTMLHHHAITKLLEKIAPTQPEGILIDQFSQPGVYMNHLKSEKASLQKNVYFMTKAESYSIAVAAGSIIARASFVKQMDKLSKEAGITIPKGASQKVDQAAAQIIKRDGIEEMERYAKVHFANTEKALKYVR
ncbi:ribonuclease HIII [Aquibacillus koreensis]|uniref:Ribonuclease HIII n=1 Tax=Aquibacillus koreensis TaxID=279446 RepID=A0A9X4AIE4_9BACI|nr:ribonuclease HIII [Aquibacillus koreensis]MCT2535066.1 ribonuclease HIII [Aquibacillus koreensis]MDC3419213.1 ribonuclease HIII [Aquibacillus koreensis]